MWKIKLAFRPGNVDITEISSMPSMNIDDPRFFGNIAPDQEYPELEDVAFSQSMLSNYPSRGKTVASQNETIQQDGYDFSDVGTNIRKGYSMPLHKVQSPEALNDGIEIPGSIPGEESWNRSADKSIERGRFSDIEVTRGQLPRHSVSTVARSSISSIGASLALRFDDDIPAFEQDDGGIFGSDAAPPVDFIECTDQTADGLQDFDTGVSDLPMIPDTRSPKMSSDSSSKISHKHQKLFQEDISDPQAASSSTFIKRKTNDKSKRQRIVVRVFVIRFSNSFPLLTFLLSFDFDLSCRWMIALS
jgi:hypothetical protein